MKAQTLKQTLIAVVLMVAFVLSGCTNQAQQASAPEGNANVAQQTTPTSPVAVDLPRLDGKATVEMVVNGSTIRMEIDGTQAPITAGNFVDLVNRGVYDGLVFHRVVRQPEPFVVQGGDPQSKDSNFPVGQLGTGSFIDPETKAPRYIPLEIKPEGATEPVYSTTLADARIAQPPVLQHTRGAVAMARSAVPDSASAQFYIALADLGFLDGSYAVFGYVTEGMEAVDKIEQGDRIESAKVTSGLENLAK